MGVVTRAMAMSGCRDKQAGSRVDSQEVDAHLLVGTSPEVEVIRVGLVSARSAERVALLHRVPVETHMEMQTYVVMKVCVMRRGVRDLE
jgi:hypothetical protein